MVRMDKEMGKKTESIVERHIHELTLQLENVSLENDEYKEMVHTLLELNTIRTMQVSLRMQSKFIGEIGD